MRVKGKLIRRSPQPGSVQQKGRQPSRPLFHVSAFSFQLFFRAFSTSFSSSGNSFAFEAKSK